MKVFSLERLAKAYRCAGGIHKTQACTVCARSITTAKAPKINKLTQKAIYNASNPHEILNTCDAKKDEIYHSSIYGKAMQQCLKYKRYGPKCIVAIMDIMLQQNCKSFLPIDDVIEFSIFFNAMVQFDQPEICGKYFKLMIETHGLTPNLIIFSTLIKSCRSQGLYKLADAYWRAMTKKYKLEPNSIVCTEMLAVYSKAHQTQKAIQLFTTYQHLADMPMLSAYLSVFTRTGDIAGMQDVLHKLKNSGFEPDAAIYADVMNAFLNAKQPQLSIEFYEKLVTQNSITPNQTMLGLKMLCLCNVLQTHSDLSDKQKRRYYKDMKDMIENVYPQYAIECGTQEYEIFLRATVARYDKEEENEKIVRVLERLIDSQHIKLRTEKSNVIDFHHYSASTAPVVLRYVLQRKLHQYWSGEGDLCLIVGQGKHRSGHNNQQGNLRSLVMNELLSLEPKIVGRIDERNKGMITIRSEYLRPYYHSNDRNF